MDFRIADTFTDSLARLTSDEQKLANTTAFDLQPDPAVTKEPRNTTQTGFINTNKQRVI